MHCEAARCNSVSTVSSTTMTDYWFLYIMPFVCTVRFTQISRENSYSIKKKEETTPSNGQAEQRYLTVLLSLLILAHGLLIYCAGMPLAEKLQLTTIYNEVTVFPLTGIIYNGVLDSALTRPGSAGVMMGLTESMK
uniref:Uncharacterized protein n=1 Tax=Glossina brevipalpis TaxID=37001 RepID=A0A1A9WQB7_9MUSC